MPGESRHSSHRGGCIVVGCIVVGVSGMNSPAKKLGAKGGVGKKGPAGKKAPVGGKKGKGAAAQGARLASTQ